MVHSRHVQNDQRRKTKQGPYRGKVTANAGQDPRGVPFGYTNNRADTAKEAAQMTTDPFPQDFTDHLERLIEEFFGRHPDKRRQ